MEILIIAPWFLLGMFLNHKKDWYDHHRTKNGELQGASVSLTFLFAPAFLLFFLFTEFIFTEWNNS